MRRTGRAVCPIRTGMDLPGVVAGPGGEKGAPWGGCAHAAAGFAELNKRG